MEFRISSETRRDIIMYTLAVLGLDASGWLKALLNIRLTEISLPFPIVTNLAVLLGYVALLGFAWIYLRNLRW